MQCPKCKTTELKPTKLEQSLPVMGCEQCEGAFISLLYYRDWAERQLLEGFDNTALPSNVEVEEQATDTKTAMTCPKCHKLMLKYKVSTETEHQLDLCGSCDEAWLDGGEWQLLKSLEFTHQMPKVFTEAWQNRIRHELKEQSRTQRLIGLIGNEDAEKVAAFKSWLDAHPKRAEVITFLNQR